MTVNAVVVAAGAGYVVPVLGNMQRMLGLPTSLQADRLDLQGGRIHGVLLGATIVGS